MSLFKGRNDPITQVRWWNRVGANAVKDCTNVACTNTERVSHGRSKKVVGRSNGRINERNEKGRLSFELARRGR